MEEGNINHAFITFLALFSHGLIIVIMTISSVQFSISLKDYLMVHKVHDQKYHIHIILYCCECQKK